MDVNNPVVSNYHVHAAGVITKASWQQEHRFHSGGCHTLFVALINWVREGERVWYCDFHEGMLKSYERLGHNIDGLKATTLKVESSHIVCRTHMAWDESNTGSFLF